MKLDDAMESCKAATAGEKILKYVLEHDDEVFVSKELEEILGIKGRLIWSNMRNFIDDGRISSVAVGTRRFYGSKKSIRIQLLISSNLK